MSVSNRSKAAFGLLLFAAAIGLLLAQRLRHSDPVVIGVRRTLAFSPVGSGPRNARISFWLKRADRIDVAVVDRRGDFVDTIAAARPVPARVRVAFRWDGRDDSGRLMPDGRYRFRVGLARQGRSLILPRSVRLDTIPARPLVLSVDPPHGSGPLILPGPHAATGTLGGTRGHARGSLVVRTDVRPARVVFRGPVSGGRPVWNGTVAGRPAPDGVYMLGLVETDPAGNRGAYPQSVDPLPGVVRGRSGVTFRRLGAAPPTGPVKAGSLVSVPVDARGRRIRWTLRAAGAAKPLAKGAGRGTSVRVRLPRGRTGLLLLAISADGRRMEVPITVVSGTHPLLVVLPSIRWQSQAPVDQDGDGLVDSLSFGRPVTLGRMLPATSAGLEGLADTSVPLIRMLDSMRQPYELTTDAALALGRGPALRGHAGAVFAGGSTWLPGATLRALNGWITGGGRLLDLGLDDLRREARLTGRTMSSPSPPRPADPAGGVRAKPSLAAAWVSVWKDDIDLFADTGGRLYAPAGSVGTASIAAPGKLVAAAGLQEGDSLVAAWTLGHGLAIHPGIAGLQGLARPGTDSRSFLIRAIRIVASGKR